MRPFPKADRWFDIKNVADTSADVFIFDVIGERWDGEGVTAKKLIADISGLKGRALNVHINSPGGSVYDGFAIYNALRAHDADVTTIVEGVAASAASTIAMAGKKIRMSSVSNMMIHDPSVLTWGNATELRKAADSLEAIKESILNSYSRSKKPREELSEAMSKETWFSPQLALEWGLADEIIEGAVPTNYLTPEIAQAFNFQKPVEAPEPISRSTPISVHERMLRLNEILTRTHR